MTRFLGYCRYILVLPVIGCLLLTLGVVLIAMGRIFTSGLDRILVADFSPESTKSVSIAVIEVIDLFLIGTVTYITALGLYKLFIRDEAVEMPFRLRINTLKDLEHKIIGLIITALAVAFLGKAAAGNQPEVLLHYGGGIALVIAALGYFLSQDDPGKTSPPED